MSTMAITQCPACANDRYIAVGSKAPPVTVEVAGRTFRQPAYRIRECIDCDLLYRDVALSAAELADYYRLQDPVKWDADRFFPTERAVLLQLSAVPRSARVLDFGCSTGRLLAPHASRYRCHGYEPNPGAAAVAARRGLHMIDRNDIEDSRAEGYDAILLIDVFEHLVAPLATLQLLWSRLNSGGVLIVATGNGDAPACRRDPAQFWYFRTPEHLCMLTGAHMRYVTRRLGGTLVCWVRVSHYDTSLKEQIIQRARDFSYWGMRRDRRYLRRMLQAVPYMRRAAGWRVAPALTCTRDHVVAVVRKPG